MTKLSGQTRGAIAGTALAVGVLTGGFWASSPDTTSAKPAAASCTVFAGRAGNLPCHAPNSDGPDSRAARRVAGSTGTGCLIGLLSGGPAGLAYGCLGGLASNIPW